MRVCTLSRGSSSWSKAPGRKSSLTIPASPRAKRNTWRRDGKAIIGSRWRNSWLRLFFEEVFEGLAGVGVARGAGGGGGARGRGGGIRRCGGGVFRGGCEILDEAGGFCVFLGD